MSPKLGLVVLLLCAVLVGVESFTPHRAPPKRAPQEKKYVPRTFGASSQISESSSGPKFPPMTGSFDVGFEHVIEQGFSSSFDGSFPLRPPPGGCSHGCESFNMLAGKSKDRFSKN
ncbi:uncharacterized protein Dyak_GE28147 [Drosophila yakuba]|uniref:Uncharacterized protein n=1 Tax=Drosophila yakuba TaxID=7245 RepID=A0A0R1DNZ2_DROYA|nr:uncharacterized protein Dyak_GE28147 [Drosophila yakuba]